MQLQVPGFDGARALVRGFFAWWGRELWSVLPRHVQSYLTDSGPAVVLAVEDAGFRVFTENGTSLAGQRKERASSNLIASRTEAVAQFGELVARIGGAEATLRIPQSACFVRMVEVPQSALGDRRRVLDLDLERATPFRAKDVYTGYLVGEATPAAAGKVPVRQFVAKRESLDPFLEELDAAGAAVQRVDCWSGHAGNGLGLNFLERQGEGQAASRLLSPVKVLAAAAVLLAIAAAYQAVDQRQAALSELRRQTAQIRAQAASVRQALDQSQVAITDLAQLQQLKLRQTPMVAVLEEVTRVLPNSVWLTELRVEGDIVDLSGLATSGATLLPLFQGSAIFADATLTAPVTFDQREDKERFSLRVRIKPADRAEKPAGVRG